MKIFYRRYPRAIPEIIAVSAVQRDPKIDYLVLAMEIIANRNGLWGAKFCPVLSFTVVLESESDLGPKEVNASEKRPEFVH